MEIRSTAQVGKHGGVDCRKLHLSTLIKQPIINHHINEPVERPRLYKVILVNDDFTPRKFVVRVLRAEFSLNESQARQVMMTAHQRGLCVVAVFARDIAETKATRATDAARKEGYPLLFTTEPEE